MKHLSENDIACPTKLITAVCGLVGVLIVGIVCGSIFVYVRRSLRAKKSIERRNVNERIVPQPIDKNELERYLAAQEADNEFPCLRQWELTIKDHFEEGDHYEKFDDPVQTPGRHVAYVWLGHPQFT